MGSGTTLQVCSHYGRESTGLELSEKYADLARTGRLTKPPLCLIRAEKEKRKLAHRMKVLKRMKLNPEVAKFIQTLLFELNHGE